MPNSVARRPLAAARSQCPCRGTGAGSPQRRTRQPLHSAEVSGGGHAALYRQMLNAAQTAFYEKGESVEAALRQAVRSIHQVLRTRMKGCPRRNGAAGQPGRALRRPADDRTIRAGPDPDQPPKTVDQFPAELGDWGPALGDAERPKSRSTTSPSSQAAWSCWHRATGRSMSQLSRWRSGGRPQYHACQPIPGTIGRQRGAERPAGQLQQHHPGVARRCRTAARCASAGGDASPAQTAAKIGIFSAAGKRLFGGAARMNKRLLRRRNRWPPTAARFRGRDDPGQGHAAGNQRAADSAGL